MSSSDALFGELEHEVTSFTDGEVVVVAVGDDPTIESHQALAFADLGLDLIRPVASEPVMNSAVQRMTSVPWLEVAALGYLFARLRAEPA